MKAAKILLRPICVSQVPKGTQNRGFSTPRGLAWMHPKQSAVAGLPFIVNFDHVNAVKTGNAAEIGPGRPPRQVPMREATDLIQSCFYYPAVVDLKELEFSREQQAALADSLEAYRSGDLNAALEKYPVGKQPASDSERLYRAALALAAGQVTDAEQLLASTDTTAGGHTQA